MANITKAERERRAAEAQTKPEPLTIAEAAASLDASDQAEAGSDVAPGDVAPEPDADTADALAGSPPVVKKRANMVMVRITKFGSGKVSSGEHVQGGDRMLEANAVIEVSADVGAALETVGYAEIQ